MTVHAPARPPIASVLPAGAPRVGGILARALGDDPVSRWIVREHRMEAAFTFYARRLWLPHEAVYEVGGGQAVACWLPPGTAHMSFFEQLRLFPGLARTAGRDLPRLLSATTLMERNHPHEPHWFLNMMGVDPAVQGRGLGSALLAHTLARCDEEGSPAYLEATTERSRALYERHGFEVTEEVGLPKGGPPFWRMWREPGA